MSEGFSSEYPDEAPKLERILTREEVIAAIESRVQGASFQRELSDKGVVYLYEVTIPGEQPGEVTEYTYQRKGVFGENNTVKTQIRVAYYEDGSVVGGRCIANYDEKTGLWDR